MSIDFDTENIDKGPKFKVIDHLRISKYKNTFSKGYTPNWSEKFFAIEEIKNTVPWAYVVEFGFQVNN